MHCNYHFFRHLAPALNARLEGSLLACCFSQEKDEMVLGFTSEESDFYIKCSVNGQNSGFFFLENFQRAKRNSVDLWPKCVGQKVIGIQVAKNERAIMLKLQGNLCILFKMYGSRSNILLFKEQDLIQVFNHKLTEDHDKKLFEYHRSLNQDWEQFKMENGDTKKIYPTWGKLVEGVYSSEKTADVSKNWALATAINQELEEPSYYIIDSEKGTALSLLKADFDIKESFSDPIEANNAFYLRRARVEQLEDDREKIKRALEKKLKTTEKYIEHTRTRLEQLQTGLGNQEIGHLIMANMHLLKDGMSQATLTNFYTNEPVSVSLKKDLSIQRNAENYYRKAKKEKLEQDFLIKNIKAKEEEWLRLSEELSSIQTAESHKELKKWIKTEETQKNKTPEVQDLFKKYEVFDYTILVGRNAKNNDLLTLKYAHKEDLWLHAKDVSGSHVIIKSKAGQNIPKNVLESAAQLAAYYSKRKTDSLVPVIYTPKKYIRKPKGAAAGAVFVEKEKVLMVTPNDLK